MPVAADVLRGGEILGITPNIDGAWPLPDPHVIHGHNSWILEIISNRCPGVIRHRQVHDNVGGLVRNQALLHSGAVCIGLQEQENGTSGLNQTLTGCLQATDLALTH